VLEAEAVESLAVGGGAGAVLAALELLLTLGVLALGAGGMLHVWLLLGVVVFTGWLAWRYWQLRERWTEARISLTHQISERMQGHRTRLVSETLEQWHRAEDALVARYQEESQRMDEELIRLEALVPHGWMVLGLLGLAPALLSGETLPTMFATSLGGILLARQVLQRLVQGLSKLAGAAIAWRQAAPMFEAAARKAHGRRPGVTGGAAGQRLLLEARGLSFQHPGRAAPVLRDASFSLRRGDRVLLEGPSGSGKSTLVALLAGLRIPDHGLLLVQGLDRATLGLRGWRRHVVAAPQFHENHVLTGTFAFNLMMGQGWPASEEELEYASKLCEELGLSPLLERMPAGMLQMVGGAASISPGHCCSGPISCSSTRASRRWIHSPYSASWSASCGEPTRCW
jgi:ATP-binding cassette subfamily B protein